MLSAFPYIGGKTRLADWIVSYLPQHTTYVEAFGGSAAVLLNKPRSKVEIFNDLNGDVVHFFDVARDRPEELAEWCRHVPFSEQLHDEWGDEFFSGSRPNDDVERAGKWLFLRYSQYAGKVAGKTGFKRESPNDEKGNRNARNWTNAPERIHRVAERFRGVSIVDVDYQSVIERYDCPETVFYLDPPYVDKEDYYPESVAHDSLETAVDDVEGFVILSYTNLPEGLYDGWTVVEKEVTHSAAGNGKMADERLVMNFDPVETPLFRDWKQRTFRSLGTDVEGSE